MSLVQLFCFPPNICLMLFINGNSNFSVFTLRLQGASVSAPKPPRARVRTPGSPGAATFTQDLQVAMETATADSPPCSRHVPWTSHLPPPLLLSPSSTLELNPSLRLNLIFEQNVI